MGCMAALDTERWLAAQESSILLRLDGVLLLARQS